MTYLDIPGWFDFEDAYDLLYDQVSEGGVVVEIGTYLGKSAAYLAMRIRDGRKVIHFFTVDHFQQGESSYPQTLANLAAADVLCQVTVLQMESAAAAALFKDSGVDAVWIDGCHDYEAVKRDIELWLPKTSRFIGGHDYTDQWPGVKSAVDEIFPNARKGGISWWLHDLNLKVCKGNTA